MQIDQEKKSEEFWDSVAAGSDSAGLAGLLSPDNRLAVYRDVAEKSVLLSRHPKLFGPRSRVLEIGCGGGRWTTWLAGRCEHVTATDISSQMIEQARRVVAAAGLANVVLQAESMDNLHVTGKFDVVYLGGCLQYMSEDAVDEGLRRVRNVLNPNGVILSRDSVSIIGRTFHRSELYANNDPAIYRPAAWYGERLANVGLRCFDSWQTYATPLFWRLRSVLPSAFVRGGMRIELSLAAAEVKLASHIRGRSPKEHWFFLYQS